MSSAVLPYGEFMAASTPLEPCTCTHVYMYIMRQSQNHSPVHSSRPSEERNRNRRRPRKGRCPRSRARGRRSSATACRSSVRSRRTAGVVPCGRQDNAPGYHPSSPRRAFRREMRTTRRSALCSCRQNAGRVKAPGGCGR